MNTPLEQFKRNINEAKHLLGLYSALKKELSEAVDVSNLLRASLVFAVSAFDHYMHETVRRSMLEVALKKREETKQFSDFRVPLGSALSAEEDDITWLSDHIRESHSWRSFQTSKNVDAALALISKTKIWPRIDSEENGEEVMKKLDLIIDRRNKIAHEADINPSYPNQRWPIDENMIRDCIDFIESLVDNIEEVLKTEKF